MYLHTRSSLDRALTNSIFLTSDFDCSSLRDKLAGIMRGRRIFLIPFSRMDGDAKTSLGKAFVGSRWHYIELRESMECNFEDFDGIMLKVRSDNSNLLLFALGDIKDILIGKNKYIEIPSNEGS